MKTSLHVAEHGRLLLPVLPATPQGLRDEQAQEVRDLSSGFWEALQ